jgi:hypothetical protein
MTRSKIKIEVTKEDIGYSGTILKHKKYEIQMHNFRLRRSVG